MAEIQLRPPAVAPARPAPEEAKASFFARVYPAWAVRADRRGLAAYRKELLEGASGRVVEVGAGTGLNFGHYPAAVTEVIAVEPEPTLRRLAEVKAAEESVPVRVLDGVASELPLADGSCDVGVASLVLCSVPDAETALDELRRVIRPGGELRFLEHVVASSLRLARVQRLFDKLFWPRLGGGCHCSRDTLAAIERAGFAIEGCQRFRFKGSPLIGLWTSPHVLGIARRV